MWHQDMMKMPRCCTALRRNEHHGTLSIMQHFHRRRPSIFPRSPPLCLHITITRGFISFAICGICTAGVPTRASIVKPSSAGASRPSRRAQLLSCQVMLADVQNMPGLLARSRRAPLLFGSDKQSLPTRSGRLD